MSWNNKRYTIRLSSQDEDIFNYLEQKSKGSKNELIKRLLRFAINQSESEDFAKLYDKLNKISKLQEQGYQDIMYQLKNNMKLVIDEDKTEESQNELKDDEDIENAINNSIDSLIGSFGDFK